MAAKIQMVNALTSAPRFGGKGAIALTSQVAKHCLKDTGCSPNDIGMLVNTGVYRDSHIAEPAIAALIQRKIGALPQQSSNSEIWDGLNGTSSFDLNNGGCGLVSGLQLMDGFIQTGKIKRGLLVTGDAEPIKNHSKSFAFAPAAAAVLLSKSDSGSGFVKFQTRTFPEFKQSFESHVSWTPWGLLRRNRNVLWINQQDNYVDLCVQCTLHSINQFFKETDLQLDDIDLIIPSQSPKGYVHKLIKQMGMADQFSQVESKKGEWHTAGPAIALHRTWQDGRFKNSGNILFICVGAGITTALALYRNDFYHE
ncbi:hypothetical protein KAR48_02800 [bacterium]|nr:hypothetical protein [bacterium]